MPDSEATTVEATPDAGAAPDTAAADTAAPAKLPGATKPTRHTGAVSRRDARARMHERHPGTLAELIDGEKTEKPAEEKPPETTEVAETGEATEKPAAAAGPEKPEETGEKTEPTETPAGDETGEKPAEVAAAPELIKVDVPADHPIWNATKEHAFEVPNEPQARAIRGLINGSYARLQEVADLTKQRDTLEEENVRLRADKAADTKWAADPRRAAMQQQYDEIRESQGQEAADQYLKGAEVDKDKLAAEEYDERMKVVQEARGARAAEAWSGAAWERASANIPDFVRNIPSYNEWFGHALKSFDKELELDQVLDPQTGQKLLVGDHPGMHRAFSTFFANRLSGQKLVIEAYRQQNAVTDQDRKTAADKAVEQNRKRQEDRADAVKNFKQDAAKKRTDGPPHPLGAVQGVDRGTLDTDGAEEKKPVTTNVHELKRGNRQRAQERIAKFFPS